MSIGLLYERSENDENGIKLTAQQLGFNLTFLPFRKIALSISKDGFSAKTEGKDYTDTIRDIAVVLNRAQGKNRRLQASYVFEMLGKKTLNCSQIEFICFSKLRTLLHLWKEHIPIPKTAYVPCDSYDTMKNGSLIYNEEDIADLFQAQIALDKGIVIKADAGTHGKMIMLAQNQQELITNIKETKPSIINPVGIVAQELIQKWFYDLRIIVYKVKGKSPVCHPVAMARAGLTDFRTNTSLGNIVFDAKLPQHVQKLALKSGEALGRGHEAWLFGLDAMINASKNRDDEGIKTTLTKAAIEFQNVQKVKQDETRLSDFKTWNAQLEKSVNKYMNTEPYAKVKDIIDQDVKVNQLGIVFHEANSCPDFWEQTRLIAGINVAVPLLKGAQSLIDN
ncbi:MAG: hypothetical protein ABSA75_09615 [Candidatus Bathyarchaeia archaeon]|jgi:glutathione synthase/RimK-type ligase-like ATP-grasp enzyme